MEGVNSNAARERERERERGWGGAEPGQGGGAEPMGAVLADSLRLLLLLLR